MTAAAERVQIKTKARRNWTRYLRASAAAVRRWAQRGQLGPPLEQEIGRASGARC